MWEQDGEASARQQQQLEKSGHKAGKYQRFVLMVLLVQKTLFDTNLVIY